ncbi:MAG: cyclase [Microcoleus sp. SIO2G3]|nr:cyclase [Microcoleus sp. SIO2G3]
MKIYSVVNGSIAVSETSEIANSPSVTAIKTEQLAGRMRRISASIQVGQSIDRVWQILTDYEHLADFIPNLAKSRRLPHPDGGIRVEQIGAQNFLNFRFCARVVLDMIENFPNRLDFQMIEGDFKQFFGSWQLEEVSAAGATQLTYSVTVLPPRTMPIALIERKLSSSMAVNLEAIRQRADALRITD